MAGLVYIGDFDDPDAGTITSRSPDLHWIQLGKPASCYTMRFDPPSSQWELSVDGESFSSSLLQNATRIIYRRWRSSPPRDLVVPTDESPIAAFVSRQWTEAMLGAIVTSYRASANKWSRDPRLVDLKLDTLAILAKLGALPETSVNMTIATSRSVKRVAKHISIDQSFQNGRVATALIGPNRANRGDGYPIISQTHLNERTELRVLYYFGRARAVSHTFPTAANEGPTNTDRRFTPSIARAAAPLTADEELLLREVARSLSLNVFTGDMIRHAGGTYLIDVNPDGLIHNCDTEDGHLASLYSWAD